MSLLLLCKKSVYLYKYILPLRTDVVSKILGFGNSITGLCLGFVTVRA